MKFLKKSIFYTKDIFLIFCGVAIVGIPILIVESFDLFEKHINKKIKKAVDEIRF
jgi:hypothetical protein